VTLEEAHRKLHKAMKRLQPDQGKIARRNARATVLAAMRTLRSALDDTYPAIRSGVKRTRLSPTQKNRRLTAAGFVPMGTGQPQRDHELLQAKITIKRDTHNRLYVPSWTTQIPSGTHFSVEWLLRGKKPAERQIILAEVAIYKARPNEHTSGGFVVPSMHRLMARVRNDKEFRDAVIIATEIGLSSVRKLLLDQYTDNPNP
jgi:hypothetical protein